MRRRNEQGKSICSRGNGMCKESPLWEDKGQVDGWMLKAGVVWAKAGRGSRCGHPGPESHCTGWCQEAQILKHHGWDTVGKGDLLVKRYTERQERCSGTQTRGKRIGLFEHLLHIRHCALCRDFIYEIVRLIHSFNSIQQIAADPLLHFRIK